MFALYRTKVQVSTPFLRNRSCAPAEPFTNVFFLFWLFFAANVASMKTQISKKNTKTQRAGEKKQKNKKKHALQARQGHIEHVCKIPGCYFLKTAWTLDSNDFGVVCLNNPVVIILSLNHRHNLVGRHRTRAPRVLR